MKGLADRGISSADERLESSIETPALEKEMAVARPATEADVGSKPVDEPLPAAARMGLPEPDDIAKVELRHGPGRHGRGAYQRRGWPSLGMRFRVLAGRATVPSGVTLRRASG